MVALPLTVRSFVSAQPSFNSGLCPAYRSSTVDDSSSWGEIHVFRGDVHWVNGGVRFVSDVRDSGEGVA
eukprot:5830888-Pyramimonas_sp.AAC.1